MSTVTATAYAPTAGPLETASLASNAGPQPDARHLDGRPKSSRLARARGFSDVLLHCFEVTSAFLKWTFTRASTCETSEIEEMFSSLSSRGIRIPDVVEVRDYLLRYPEMTDVVALVCDLASEHFGAGTQLSLEVYHDPEMDDEYLTLHVRQQRYEQHIMKKIEDLWKACGPYLADTSGWLLLTTDFAPPI
ncbi:MAG: hypothetical protein Q8Q12_12260 [bacterium]|nr:hypothetical protein [bacterium]